MRVTDDAGAAVATNHRETVSDVGVNISRMSKHETKEKTNQAKKKTVDLFLTF